MIFGDLRGLKLPDICLTGEEKPRKSLNQETCPDRGSNSSPLRNRRACYRLVHNGGRWLVLQSDSLPRESPRYSFYRWLSGSLDQSGHEGVKKNLHLLRHPGSNARCPSPRQAPCLLNYLAHNFTYNILLFMNLIFMNFMNAVEQAVYSMRACHAAGPGSIPGRDKFPG